MKSTAAVAHSLKSPFVVEDVELPDLQPTDVLVRIVAVGVCHTDIASRDGQLPAPFPAIFGHEGAGVVERVGDQVRKVTPGDHVVLAPDSDGTCEQCASGAPTYCEHFLELNFQAGPNGRTVQLADGRRASIKYFGQSSFAHHAVASERSVVKVRKELPLKLLGPLGCSIQTGAVTVMNGLRPQPGSSIAVLGAGAVGMAAILGSRVSGCAKIIAVDRIDSRLEVGSQLGATHVINTTRAPDLGKAMRAVAPSRRQLHRGCSGRGRVASHGSHRPGHTRNPGSRGDAALRRENTGAAVGQFVGARAGSPGIHRRRLRTRHFHPAHDRPACAGAVSVRQVRPLLPIQRNQSRCGGSAQWKRDQADPRSQRRMRAP
jgi:Zn-dependent alcohol dehydrogenase